jgi:hypothetical protein
MHRAFLALAVLLAGCATPEPDQEISSITVRRHQRTTQVIQKPQETHFLRLVGEPNTPPQPVARPVAPAAPAPGPAPQPAARLQIVVPQPQPTVDFIQVGPPVVLDSPTPPAPVYQPPPPSTSPMVNIPRPSYTPTLETAEGLSYQNGGVNGTTNPPVTPSPALPTAEGFQYHP